MPFSTSATRSSELARIAAEAAGTRSSSVRFALVHGPDHVLPVAMGNAEQSKDDLNAWPTDFCHFAVAGMSVSTTTWPSAESAFSGRVQIGAPERLPGRRDSYAYAGHAVPNPGFLNQSTRKLDVLITLGNTHWSPTYREALMQALIIEQLSRLAADLATPVLHLHTPVAPLQRAAARRRLAVPAVRHRGGPETVPDPAGLRDPAGGARRGVRVRAAPARPAVQPGARRLVHHPRFRP
jgi:hypothetical protein